MRANWQKWTDDQIGLELAGTPDELRKLADALTARGWKFRLITLLGSVMTANAILGLAARLTGLPRHM